MEHSGFLTFFYRRFEATFSIGKDTTEYSFMLPAFSFNTINLFHPPYTTRGVMLKIQDRLNLFYSNQVG